MDTASTSLNDLANTNPVDEMYDSSTNDDDFFDDFFDN